MAKPAAMTISEAERIELRRAAHDLKDEVIDLFYKLDRLEGFEDAAAAVRRARLALFEAWTILCFPPDEDDDEEH